MLLTIGNVPVFSPFSLVSRILTTEEFGQAPEQAIGPGDIPIGRLNGEEQAILTAWNTVRVESASLAQAIASFEGGGLDIEEIHLQASVLDEWSDALSRLFWATLCGRFAKKIASSGANGLAIRSDFQLVAYHKVTAPNATIVEVALPH